MGSENGEREHLQVLISSAALVSRSSCSFLYCCCSRYMRRCHRCCWSGLSCMEEAAGSPDASSLLACLLSARHCRRLRYQLLDDCASYPRAGRRAGTGAAQRIRNHASIGGVGLHLVTDQCRMEDGT